MSPQLQTSDVLVASGARAMRRSADALLTMPRPEGYWWADLTADTTLESDWILLQLWLHPPEEGVWSPPTRNLIDKAVRAILRRQLPDGGFNIYPKGPADVSATVKAYFALKLAGVSVEDSRMIRARETVLKLGGIQAANSYVKVNLSLFGLFPRQFCPSIPPELMFLPGDFIYQMSSWTRAIVIPLSIVHAMDPRRPVPAGFDVKELFVEGGVRWNWLKDREFATRRNIFLTLDAVAKVWEKFGSKGIRTRAIRRAEQVLARLTAGAIYRGIKLHLDVRLLGRSSSGRGCFSSFMMVVPEDEISFSLASRRFGIRGSLRFP
ncbi:MAG: prenyltransferase/squalene oxidase repeat-containing protein [Bryobacteraceae bacterium]